MNAGRAWNRFWFEPEPTSTLAVVRVAYGAVVLAWALALGPDLRTFYAEDGIMPFVPRPAYWTGVFHVWESYSVVVAGYVVLLVAAVALLVGWRTRLASVLVFVGVLSFQRRAPYVFNSGDTLVRNIGLFLALAPAGVSLSVDRWRRREPLLEFPLRAPWALRLIQVQLTIVYLSTVWAKVRGDVWNDGTAFSFSLQLDDLTRFEVPDLLVESALASGILTYATLATELAIPILLWTRLRPWMIAVGLAFHLVIDLTLHVGFFSMIMAVAYLSFVPPEPTAAWLRARLGGRTVRSRGRPGTAATARVRP